MSDPLSRTSSSIGRPIHNLFPSKIGVSTPCFWLLAQFPLIRAQFEVTTSINTVKLAKDACSLRRLRSKRSDAIVKRLEILKKERDVACIRKARLPVSSL
ncbi:hypothetical protein Dimus_037589 [Dionaea muscipula]